MDYTIEKISISEPDSWVLINKLAAEVREQIEDSLDKKGVEIIIPSSDDVLNICLKIKFNSEYRRVDGGIETVNRGVECGVKMYEIGGNEVEFVSPISIEEEIETIFYI